MDGYSAGTSVSEASGPNASETSSAPETRIIIDGSGEDWAGRPLLLDDPAGNAESGILDLTKGYAFVNQHALYLLVEVDDPDVVFTNFEVALQVGPKRLEVYWAPGWNQGTVADVTGQWQRVGDASNSQFAFGPALEARIDLRDLGSPDSVKLIGVKVRAGKCCEAGEWRIADRWEPLTPIPVLESLDGFYRVDGKDDDWKRSVLSDDPAGDSRPGTLDLTAGYAFISEGSLYLYVDALDATAAVDSFQIILQTGPTRLEVGWGLEWNSAHVADVTNGWTLLRRALSSEFAFSSGFEARISLVDLGVLDDTVGLIEVIGRPGPCCEPVDWDPTDRWDAYATTPVVNEADLAWKLAPVAGAVAAERLLSAPDTRKISLRYNAGTRRALITGQVGAVPEGSSLFVGNTELNDFVMLNADSSGAFATEVAAAPGTHVLIKQDITGKMNPLRPGMADNNMIAPGVVLRVPVEPAADGIAFGAGARMCCNNELSASWTIKGTFEQDKLSPGQQFVIKGRVAILTDSLAPPTSSTLNFRVFQISDADGRQVGRSGRFITPFLTQTGLPIERAFQGPPLGDVWLGQTTVSWEIEDSRWVADFTASVRVPEDIRPGLYGLIAGGLEEVKRAAPEPPGFRTVAFSIRDKNAFLANLGAVTIGDTKPLRLAVTLLADQLSEGSRGGLLAREDQGSFDISTRAVTRHEPVIPRLDGYGEVWPYRLEPYLPMLDAVDRSLPNGPSLLFDFDDSGLTITIERPDGGTDVLGPAPLTRYATKSPRTPWHVSVGSGGGELREVPQLQGAGDEFAYQFPADGEYVITLDGHIAGIDGRKHLIQGTYDLTIANVLDIETALLPTTPFEIGDSMPVAVTIFPQVPADIFYTVTQVGADGQSTSETFRGRANRNGWWDGDGATWTFVRDGEYRVDVQACYSEPPAGLWSGRLRFGGVVATPDSPIVAHGRRGSDGLVEIPAPWGFESAYEYRDGITAPHMHLPYFTGDILWGTQLLHVERDNDRNAGTAVVTHMSFQSLDDNNSLIMRAKTQAKMQRNFNGQTIDAMIQAGQIPLITAPESGSRKSGAHPDDIDLWAYVYSSAERPGVRVREIIKGDDVGGSYWRFNDAYHMQSGNGRQGDLPGDFKFFYGGVVIRDAVNGDGIYAIYGSSWVLLPDDDPDGSRFMPPYQGAAGGPNGGPLFTVHGREIDMFFMPMGVRPGAVLETGDTFRMAGPIMPTLPSLVDYTVVAPDGTKRTLGGRANAIGYFYDPDDDFVLDQPGLWNVELTVTHDGMTSAGPVEQPYPTGGLLTPDGTTFTFSVIDQNTNRLEITTDLEDLTPAEWFTNIRQASFQTTLPPGWAGNQARLTVTMPGIVLIDEVVRVESGLVVWELDGEALNQLAKNFDYEQGIADTITVTIFAEGSVAGQPAQAAGTMVTHGARVPRVPMAE